MKTITLWDWPVRICHWAMVLLVSLSYVTAELGGNWIDWHERAGLALIAVLAFRLAWGFVGSPAARFAVFVRGPRSILNYLRGHWQGAGHNPLGALSVLALLGLFSLQAGLGLFSNDDIAFNGPLYTLVGKEQSDWLTGIHRSLYWWLLALVGLHLSAILFYHRVKRENLLSPMLHGRKTLPDAQADRMSARRSALRQGIFLMIALAFAAGVWSVAAGIWLPEPPPPPPTPAW